MKRYGLIYIARNILTNLFYVGQTTTTLNARKAGHFHDAEKRKQNNKFANAIRKYGRDAFIFEEIIFCFDKEELDKREIEYILIYDSINYGYNLKSGGAYGKHSDDTKRKIGQKAKETGNWKTGLEAAAKANKGRKHSNESKEKMSKAKKGKPNNKIKGIKRSEDTKKKMSKSQTGKTRSPEQRDKISKTLMGKSYLTEEGRKAISNANKGRTHTEEVKERLSKAKIGSLNPMYGKTPSESTLEKIRVAVMRDDGKVYASLSEAARDNNRTVPAIRYCAIGKTKLCNGHNFFFINKNEDDIGE